jgi:hypothetical protein
VVVDLGGGGDVESGVYVEAYFAVGVMLDQNIGVNPRRSSGVRMGVPFGLETVTKRGRFRGSTTLSGQGDFRGVRVIGRDLTQAGVSYNSCLKVRFRWVLTLRVFCLVWMILRSSLPRSAMTVF